MSIGTTIAREYFENLEVMDTCAYLYIRFHSKLNNEIDTKLTHMQERREVKKIGKLKHKDSMSITLFYFLVFSIKE